MTLLQIENFGFMTNVIAVAPVIGVLIWVILYFRAEIKRKDERIDSLTDEILDISKDQIKVNQEVKSVLDILKSR